MSETNPVSLTPAEATEPEPRRFPWAVVVLGLGLAASFGVALRQHNTIVNTRMEIASLQRELSSVRQTISNSDMNLSQALGVLRTELDSARKENQTTTERAKAAAGKQAETLASQLSTKLNERQELQQKQVAEQLDQIKSRADQATARLTDITTEVGTVKTDVASTRSQLDRTIADLHRTTGDLGIMSGLIATNSKELAALREIGEREYFEFTIARTSAPQRVGDIQVQLKRADPKRNRFTLQIVADDKSVEKKDRNVNEPVQFYVVSKARQPYELVVNEVRKDTVVGYLATPKVKAAGRRL
ncbi:MAG: hypothetical protein HY858_01370 [Candidatus Solibacter usitatus]|nr:hypothetical protein [Candidatus Solibacter usitatus]